MNDSSKNSGNKVVKSNRFPRADEQVQFIKKMIDLIVNPLNANLPKWSNTICEQAVCLTIS